MIRRILLGICVIALAGCASRVWVKDGASRDDLAEAKARCRMGVASLPPAGIFAGVQEHDYFSNCMVADGWRLGAPVKK